VWGKLVATYIAAQTAIALLLIHCTDSTVPLWDSFTTALSIVGMWMLARKYIEQWWVWMVVDITSSALYVYKGLYFTAALYAVYAIISIFGYYKWQRMMPKENDL
jgi:nicotinamide mononucleotide transporter